MVWLFGLGEAKSGFNSVDDGLVNCNLFGGVQTFAIGFGLEGHLSLQG